MKLWWVIEYGVWFSPTGVSVLSFFHSFEIYRRFGDGKSILLIKGLCHLYRKTSGGWDPRYSGLTEILLKTGSIKMEAVVRVVQWWFVSRIRSTTRHWMRLSLVFMVKARRLTCWTLARGLACLRWWPHDLVPTLSLPVRSDACWKLFCVFLPAWRYVSMGIRPLSVYIMHLGTM